MSGFSSFKESKLLFENWRRHVNEKVTPKVAQELGDFSQMSDEEQQAFMNATMPKEEDSMTLQEDRHTDVASAMRKMSIACESAQELLEMLSQMPQEDDLPSWWMSKATLAADYITKMRNYLVHPTEEEEQTPLVGEKKDPVPDEISRLIRKGKPRKQAFAIAHNMKERGDI